MKYIYIYFSVRPFRSNFRLSTPMCWMVRCAYFSCVRMDGRMIMDFHCHRNVCWMAAPNISHTCKGDKNVLHGGVPSSPTFLFNIRNMFKICGHTRPYQRKMRFHFGTNIIFQMNLRSVPHMLLTSLFRAIFSVFIANHSI